MVSSAEMRTAFSNLATRLRSRICPAIQRGRHSILSRHYSVPTPEFSSPRARCGSFFRNLASAFQAVAQPTLETPSAGGDFHAKLAPLESKANSWSFQMSIRDDALKTQPAIRRKSLPKALPISKRFFDKTIVAKSTAGTP